MKVHISLNKDTAEKSSRVYDILTTSDSTSLGADEWLDRIQRDKDNLIRRRSISVEAITHNDVWKESHALRSYNERKMIQDSQKQDTAWFCALNEPGMIYLLDQPPSSKSSPQ